MRPARPSSEEGGRPGMPIRVRGQGEWPSWQPRRPKTHWNPVASGSTPAGQQVEQPATANVWPWPSAVVQDAGVVAARVLQGVGQDGQVVEATVLVDGIGEGRDGGRPPGGIEGDGAEGVADDVPENG